MNGYLLALEDAGVPDEALKGIMDGFDVNIYIAGNQIPLSAMYGILLGTCAILLAVFVTIVIVKNKNK